MDKANHTYQTPAGWVSNAPELPGALWYGVVYRGVPHQVAVIEIDPDDGMLLVSGETFYGWLSPESITRDAE